MASALIGALRVSLGLDTAAFSEGVKQAQTKLAAVGAVLRKAIVPLAAAGTAAAAGMAVAVRGSINAADEMSKSAAKFGIPIEELSRLKYAADLSDVSLETLGTSVGILSKNMVKAAEGTGPAAEAFAKFGIEVTNADGSLRSSTDVLAQIADRLAAMPDGAEKSALAMALLGRGGKEMIPLLNGGAEALAAMMAEADRFGQVFSAEAGAQAEQFNDNLTRLQGAFGNLSADLAVKVLPHLAAFTDWLVANGPRIADAIAKLVSLGAAFVPLGQAIAQGIKVGGDAVVEFAQTVYRGHQRVVELVQGIPAQLQALQEAVASRMAEIAAAFHGLVEQFAQIGRDLIDGLVQGIRERVSGAVEAVKGVGTSIIAAARSALGIQSPSTVFAEIGRNVMQGLQRGIEGMTAGVKDTVGSFAQDLASQFSGILTGATDWRDALNNVLEGVANRLLQANINSIGVGLGIPGFANGTRFAPGGLAVVGERGPEVMYVPRGAQVIPNHRLGGGGGGGNVSVQIFGAPPGTRVEESTGAGGMRQVKVLLRDSMKDMFSDGSMDSTMRANYGLGRKPR